VSRASIRLEAASAALAPGDTVEVAIFLTDALVDLRGYQLHLSVSGGARGRLELVDLLIEDHDDHVFAGRPYWTAFNLTTRQLVAGLDSAGVPAAGQSYLATAVLRASPEAAGAFTVELLQDAQNPAHRTFLFPTPSGAMIEVAASMPAVVKVGQKALLGPRRLEASD
jgi:hypothetical protein